MEIKITNNNTIAKRSSPSGVQYIANLGTIIYNNRLININNLVIPILNRSFFTLPADKGKYAAVNVYYDIESASFVYDKVGMYSRYVNKASARAKDNVVPICQFILKQESKSYIVDHINEYAQMATFSISDSLTQGITGLRGLMGQSGTMGQTGVQGLTGIDGIPGDTGEQGITGLGIMGYSGPQGDTGYYPDLSLQWYLKFKSDDTIVYDYSLYERDAEWGVSGGNSYFTKEDGIVDSCHKVTYEKGYAAYKRNVFLPFGESGAIYYPVGIGASVTGTNGYTGGTVSAWININQVPVVDFGVTGTAGGGLTYKFSDDSLFFPDSWTWDFGDGKTATEQNPAHTFSAAGDYAIKLIASNSVGSATKYKLVTIS